MNRAVESAPRADADARAVVPPWASWIAALVIGMQAVAVGSLALLGLVGAVMGGGFSSSDDSRSTMSWWLGVALALGLAAAVGVLGWMALGIRQGRLVPSLVVACLCAGVVAYGLGDLAFGSDAAGPAWILQGMVGPAVVLTCLLSRPHRRYVTLQRLSRETSPSNG